MEASDIIYICLTNRHPRLQVVADHLSMEEVAEIKELFEMMDVNNNGKITLEELKHGLQKVGYQLPDADVKILMDAASISPDNTMLFYTFIINVDQLHRIFKMLYLF